MTNDLNIILNTFLKTITIPSTTEIKTTNCRLKTKTQPNKKKNRPMDLTMKSKKLQALTKAELVERCKEKNLNCYGTKFDMVQRLISTEKVGVVHKIHHKIPQIVIRKDPLNGYYIHEESDLVFDVNERKVTGKKQNDGTISSLTYRDIQQCLKYKFKYILPENLAGVIMTSNKCNDNNDLLLENRLKEIEENTGSNREEEEVGDDEEEDMEEGNT